MIACVASHRDTGEFRTSRLVLEYLSARAEILSCLELQAANFELVQEDPPRSRGLHV
jgi:hypothetical protein